MEQEITKLRSDVQQLTLEFREFIAAQRQICAAAANSISDCRHTLYGNGQPGLKTQFEALKARIDMLLIGFGALTTATVGVVVQAVWGAITK